jgi:integrase
MNQLRGGSLTAVPFSVAALDWIKTKSLGDTDLRNVERLSDFFKNKSTDQITADDWLEFCRQRMPNRRPATVNRIRSTLSAVLNSASINVELYKARDKSERNVFLSVDEQERLLATYPDYVRPFFICLCYQGLRRNEAISLQWRDVNLETKTIQIRDENSKSGIGRIIPLHPRTQAALAQRHPTYVFVNRFEQPYAKEGPRAAHETARARAGLDYFRIHDWRHHWASRLVMVGASVKTLMALGGWSSERMVMRYTAVSDEHNRDTLNKL